MKTIENKEYIAPEVKFVEVMVEEGYALSGVVNEKHEVDEEIDVW